MDSVLPSILPSVLPQKSMKPLRQIGVSEESTRIRGEILVINNSVSASEFLLDFVRPSSHSFPKYCILIIEWITILIIYWMLDPSFLWFIQPATFGLVSIWRNIDIKLFKLNLALRSNQQPKQRLTLILTPCIANQLDR